MGSTRDNTCARQLAVVTIVHLRIAANRIGACAATRRDGRSGQELCIILSLAQAAVGLVRDAIVHAIDEFGAVLGVLASRFYYGLQAADGTGPYTALGSAESTAPDRGPLSPSEVSWKGVGS